MMAPFELRLNLWLGPEALDSAHRTAKVEIYDAAMKYR